MNNKPIPAPNREIVHGVTPGGGAYQITYYFDRGFKPVVKEQAAHAIIHEYDDNGRSLRRTYLDFVPELPQDSLPPATPTPPKPTAPQQGGSAQQGRPQQSANANAQWQNGQRPNLGGQNNGQRPQQGGTAPQGRNDNRQGAQGNGQRPPQGRNDNRPNGQNGKNGFFGAKNAQGGNSPQGGTGRPDSRSNGPKPNNQGSVRPQNAGAQNVQVQNTGAPNAQGAQAQNTPAQNAPAQNSGGRPHGFHDRRGGRFAPRRDQRSDRPKGDKPNENRTDKPET